MKELNGTKTEQNLRDAFAGECMANNKYYFYAARAAADGYRQMAEIFEETAKNEHEHAKIWFRLLHGGEMPATPANLEDAAEGEYFEWNDMYDRMAKEAEEEDFADIAALFRGVGAIEKEHENRYRKLIANLKDGIVFSRFEDRIWQCRNCGHIVIGKKAPEICPVCSHPQAFFQLKPDNY